MTNANMCGWFGWSLGEGVSKPAKETESWVLDHYQVERAVFLSILCRLWPCHLTIHMIWRFVIQKDTYLKPISSSRKTPCIKGCIVLHLFCFIFHKLVTTVNLSLSLSLSLFQFSCSEGWVFPAAQPTTTVSHPTPCYRWLCCMHI